MKKNIKDAVISSNSTIKQAMSLIDHSGLRIAYIVGSDKKLLGAVSDSEIRKSILKGNDIRSKVTAVLNPNPIFITEKDLKEIYPAKQKVKKLLEKMADSKYILFVNSKGIPAKLIPCADIIGETVSRNKVNTESAKSILIVGGAGYLGSVLSLKLLSKGFSVKVLDNLLYGNESLKSLSGKQNFTFVEGDMRNISTLVQVLSGTDAVINLAAIVGDPACKNRPELAIETNYLANKALAEASKYHQINRFLYASTCSVYGVMEGNKKLDENSPLNPVSLYARSKIHSEEGVMTLQDENFSPTILRMSTLYGFSPRMRFDLVVNTMTKNALKQGQIHVHGGGSQWRPLLSTEDAAEAYIKCLEAPLKAIKGQIFNVGSDEQNYRIIDLANIVKKCVPSSEIIFEGANEDARNYLVSFKKINTTIGYKTSHSVEESVKRIAQAINSGEVTDLDNPKYYNVESL